MKLHLASDLHLDHCSDKGAAWLDQLANADSVQVLVLAGDICDLRNSDQLSRVFARALELYEHVLFVPGNHEYYGGSPALARRSIELAAGNSARIWAFLRPGFAEISGQEFLAGTMWYPARFDDALYDQWVNDSRMIRGFRPWVHEQNDAFRCVLLAATRRTVVVSHHLPSERSTPPRFRDSPGNRYFVCDVEDDILHQKPRAWLHGHTHDPCDYVLGDTRVVCHPRGYPRERQGWREYQPLLVEV